MASSISQQYAYRAQKTLGLVGGSPNYAPAEGFVPPEATARQYQYSADGRLFALAVPEGVKIYEAESAALVQELQMQNVVEVHFSPRGTYISTWERPVKLEDGAQHKNLRVFSVSTGEQLVAFTQKSQDGWDLQYTISESHAVRLVGQEVQVFNPGDWGQGVVSKLKVEGATAVTLSPGLNPSVAVFVRESKGQPAKVLIYGLLTLTAAPTCQKTFFKAEQAKIKWNTLGTQVLVFTQTDVDNSNKSYYGETNLYLLSAAGNFDCRVALDKEGPIHDFNWSPNSKEFAVIYGYMPAKSVLFDQRTRVVHDFGTGFYNTVQFNPQARLLLLAGFGNLAGKVDIHDRKTLNKVTTIDAANTSHCEWSPDGRFLLTATLSPRLRVDNGIKVWHCTGPLLHVQSTDDLYQAGWRPAPVDALPAFGAALPASPAPHATVAAAVQPKAVPARLGAYRPPGAHGSATSDVYRREEEGGVRSPPPGSVPGAAPGAGGLGVPHGVRSPNGRYSRSPMRAPHGRRHIPGAATSPSPGPERDNAAKGKKKGKGAKKGDGASVPASGTATPNGERGRAPGVIDIQAAANTLSPLAAMNDNVPETPGDGLDPVAKKVRNLNKKLKAIEELKEKQTRGERLEATQVKKIDSEVEIRKELADLSVS